MVDNQKVDQSSWDRETGLVNDVDAVIKEAWFGKSEAYSGKITAPDASSGLQFLIKLADKDGNELGTQGFSVGSGYTPTEDGAEIGHPTRKNVVGSSRYGELQERVIEKLGVDMASRSKNPLTAAPWVGFYAHWMQEEHATVATQRGEAGAKKSTGIMPTQFLGWIDVSKMGGGAKAPTAAAEVSGDVMAKLKVLAQKLTQPQFQTQALNISEVVNNDKLMNQVLDEGPTGFYATNHAV
jgi:hypothetical protein